ncbi:restriction endonuclease subunit S [Staphylococcus succinus]
MINTDNLRKKILDLAVRGKLVSQDVNDEPVSVLLDRIKNEKEQLIKEKKIKRNKNESYIYKDMDGSHYEKYENGTIKSIQEEIPFEIPESWQWVRLEKLGNITSGGTPSTKLNEYWEKGEIPFVTPADMGKNKEVFLKSTAKTINELGLKKSSAKLIKENSIVFSSRAPIGHINIIPYEYVTNQGCKSLTPIINNNKLIYYYLIKLTPYIKLKGTGSTFKEISVKVFSESFFPLPPIEEQQRIVKYIDQIMESINQIERAQEQLRLLRVKIDSRVLSLAIQGKLGTQNSDDELVTSLLGRIKEEKQQQFKEKQKKRNKKESYIYKDENGLHHEKYEDGTIKCIQEELPFEIPESWQWVRLCNVSEIIMGQSPKSETVFDIKKENCEEFHQGKTNFGKMYLNSSNKYTNSKSKIIEKNNILMSVRAPVGDVNINLKSIIIGRGLAGIKPIIISKKYLYYTLSSMKQLIEIQGTGSTFKAINTSKIQNLYIPLAPISEQNRIVNLIEKTRLDLSF